MYSRLIVFCFLVLFLNVKAYALGPVDGEVTLNYWDAELTAADGASDNTVETGFLHADLWFFDKFGMQAEWHDMDVSFDLSRESANVIDSRKNIMLRYRPFSFSDNNFIALGAGIEQIDFKNAGSANGPKLSAQWRVGLPLSIHAYVNAAIVPLYGDTDELENLSSIDYEAALHVTPFPFVSLRGGYRVFKLDYDGQNIAGDGNDFEGLFIGIGFHW